MIRVRQILCVLLTAWALPAVPSLAGSYIVVKFGGELYDLDPATATVSSPRGLGVAALGVSTILGIAFSPSDGKLYGMTVTSTGAQDYLLTIEPHTGNWTVIGSSAPCFGGGDLAFDPTTGILYTTGDYSGAGGNLCTVDTQTGQTTVVGAINNRNTGLAFTPSGDLYLLDLTADVLVQLDKTTGATISSMPVTPNNFSPFAGTMDYDPDLQMFMAFESLVSPRVYTVDPPTGTMLLLGTTNMSAPGMGIAHKIPLCPESDLDGDGIENWLDNCPTICNPSQANTGGGPKGDACDGNQDRELELGVVVDAGPDGVLTSVPAGDDVVSPCGTVIWTGPDGCAETTAAPGDVQVHDPADPVLRCVDCDTSVPGLQADSVLDMDDNCPAICNTGQEDIDDDGIGDACCPGIYLGTGYCVTGTGTGTSYCWGIDVNGDQTVDPSEPKILQADPAPSGGSASMLASAFADSINLEGTYGATSSGNCFTLSSSTVDLFVGAANGWPDCKVTTTGCSYNPVITLGPGLPGALIPTLSVSGAVAATLGLGLCALTLLVRRRRRARVR